MTIEMMDSLSNKCLLPPMRVVKVNVKLTIPDTHNAKQWYVLSSRSEITTGQKWKENVAVLGKSRKGDQLQCQVGAWSS